MHRSRAFLIVTALTLLSAWRLLPHFGSSLPSDLGDPILGSWIFWWNANALPLSEAWWSAPMYVPMAGTFAFSEALLSMLPLSTPLQWLGVNPIATHNVLYLLSYPMAGLGAYALTFTLTKRRDAALIAALAFAFNPYRIAQLPHIQIQWSCWMPLALAALHNYIDRDKRSLTPLVLFGVCWTLNGFTNGYVLVYFPVLVGIWVLWFSRSFKQMISIAAAAAIASLPIVPMLLGYIKWQHFYGFAREISEIRLFSADLFAIFAAAPRAWLPAMWALPPGPEGELYPGLAILGLAIAGVFISVRAHPDANQSRATTARRVVIGLAITAAALAIVVMVTGGSDIKLGSLSLSVHRPSRLLTVAFWLAVGAMATSPLMKRAWASRSPFAFYAIAAAVMYFFALGPEPHAGATQVLYKPPYAWLMYFPGFDSVRVPARFGLLMLVCLVQAAAIAFVRLTPEKGTPGVFSPGKLAMLFVAVAILLEGWIVMPVAALPAPLTVPQRAKDAGAIVLEMPVSPGFEPNTIALYNQMTHGRPIANGFAGYMPPHYYSLFVALEYGDETALEAIRAAGPLAVFIHAARDKTGNDAALVARAAGAELLERTDRGAWYLLPGLTVPADPAPSGPAIVPASVSATSNPEMAAALTDGNYRTRWHGHVNEPGNAQDDTLTLTFDRAVDAGFLEFDQGLWAAAFARDLEVVGVTDSGPVTLFRGSLAGRVIRAAIGSPNAVVRVPLNPAAPVRSIKLIGHMRGEKWTWSVGEIRVYGK